MAIWEPATQGRRVFTVTFTATGTQSQTVATTFMRMVDVLDVTSATGTDDQLDAALVGGADAQLFGETPNR